MTIWSIRHTSISASDSLSARVNASSARDGSGRPLGCWCTHRRAAALTAKARFRISRGYTEVWLMVPRATSSKAMTPCWASSNVVLHITRFMWCQCLCIAPGATRRTPIELLHITLRWIGAKDSHWRASGFASCADIATVAVTGRGLSRPTRRRPAKRSKSVIQNRTSATTSLYRNTVKINA